MSRPHAHSHWLTGLRYLEDKAIVVAEFSSAESKQTVAYSFMPSAYANISGFGEKGFRRLAGSFSKERVRLEFTGNSTARITCRTYTALRELLFSIKAAADISYLLINPERQFLLSHGWSYFMPFSFDAPVPEPHDELVMPAAHSAHFRSRLDLIADELLEEDERLCRDFLTKLALSSILRVAPEALPSTEFEHAEIMLENMLFRNSFVPVSGERKPSNSFAGRRPLLRDAEALDFSLVWLGLLSGGRQNTGFETINCNCCRPLVPDAQNILPNSVVEVTFLADGCYFESLSESWARDFHELMPDKERRLNCMRERCCAYPPAGPFFRDRKQDILLADALLLEKEGIVRVGMLKEPSWFCLRKRSFMETELSAVAKTLESLRGRIITLERKALSRGIVEYNTIFSELEYLFPVSYHSALERTASSIPSYLLSGGKHFYRELSEIMAIRQKELMLSFREFCSKKGARVLFVAGSTAYARGGNILSISREFSEISKIRAPQPKQPC
jgi:hypothetical protein